ncbi:hypothetical protein [Chryseobacterium lathyri]|uniref:hypothetical protein n=1 Tax=Chryseobacterium lathyri TaxID=395933 RepID=UPI00277F4831|nr:hypothetical protein [Chryseobacterium lathyri]MDQ0066046.1 hypothetical protein [Chryseobacterium lathyri]
MEKLIYTKIQEYDSNLKDFEISYSNHPLILDDLITLYKGRNKLAKDESIKKITLQILNDLLLIKKKSIEFIKFVTVKKDEARRLFFFNEDYSEIFSDFTFPKEDSESNWS